MDGYTLSISRCSGGDGVEESFKAKIKRREAALDAFAVAEAYCKESWMVSRCEREGFDGFIIDLCSDAEDETIRLVRLVPDSEDGIMDDVFRLESYVSPALAQKRMSSSTTFMPTAHSTVSSWSTLRARRFQSSRRFPAPLPSHVPQQPVCPWRSTTRRAMWSPRLSCLQIRF